MVYKNHCCYGTCKSDSQQGAYSDSKIWTGFFHKFPASTKTQHNKNIMCKRSTVLTHIFLHLHSKQSCKFVYTSVAFSLKRVPAALFTVNLIKFNSALSRI